MSELIYIAETLRACAEIASNPSNDKSAVRSLLGLDDFQDYEYTDAFVLEIVPDSAVFLSDEAVLGGEPTERVVGFHRVLGMENIADPTGLVGQLQYYASLLSEIVERQSDPESLEILNKIRSSYLFEHVLVWLPMYASYLEHIFPKLKSWAGAIIDVFENEAIENQVNNWDILPSALATRPTLRDVGADAGLDVFASPFITGFIVSKSLLRKLGSKYEVPPRFGTRKFMLSSMFQQDGDATLELLGEVATTQLQMWTALEASIGTSARSWRINAEISIEEINSGRAELLSRFSDS